MNRAQRIEKIHPVYEPDDNELHHERLAMRPVRAKDRVRAVDASTPIESIIARSSTPISTVESQRRARSCSEESSPKLSVIKSVTRASSKSSCGFGSICNNCHNCRALSNLTECVVCLNSLQSNQIKSCQICANVVCMACAIRLTKCAFCRSSLPPERNRALERLIDGLVLPCRNSRSGCKVMLNGDTRFIHESICNFSSTNCPVGRGICGWYGTVSSIPSHLQTVHNLQPLQDHGISIEIHSFRSKAKANGGRVYTVCLDCYEQLFVIRIILYQSRLRLCFTRLGHANAQLLRTHQYNNHDEYHQRDLPRYGILVSLKAHSPNGRHQLRGLVPFGKFDREGREVSFTCDSLFQTPAEPVLKHPKQSNGSRGGCPTHGNNRDAATAGVCREDLVKIDLLVKRLDQPN